MPRVLRWFLSPLLFLLAFVVLRFDEDEPKERGENE